MQISLRRAASHPQSVFVYDNMNFKDTTRHEVSGHAAEMRAVTTAAIVHCPELPLSGLLQEMHNPTRLLSAHEVLLAPSFTGDKTGRDITASMIHDAVCRIHSDGVDAVFATDGRARPHMPTLETIPLHRTQYQQYGAIMADEGTIEGTYTVHDELFLKQGGLGDDEFTRRLFLVFGDQLTSLRMRSVKAQQALAQRLYDRRDWLLGIPGWFHIQLNLMYTIIRTHWSTSGAGDQSHHTLHSDSEMWGRTKSSHENAKYHLMEPIIAQGFTSRVIALFYDAMKRAGFLHQSVEDVDSITEAIGGLTPAQFVGLVEDVRVTAFTKAAWRGDGHMDIEFRTMCRMLQEVELFLTVRHAVKHGDIGMLRRLVDPCKADSGGRTAGDGLG